MQYLIHKCSTIHISQTSIQHLHYNTAFITKMFTKSFNLNGHTTLLPDMVQVVLGTDIGGLDGSTSCGGFSIRDCTVFNRHDALVFFDGRGQYHQL